MTLAGAEIRPWLWPESSAATSNWYVPEARLVIDRTLSASLGDPTGPHFTPNALMAAFNIAGVHFSADLANPFSQSNGKWRQVSK